MTTPRLTLLAVLILLLGGLLTAATPSVATLAAPPLPTLPPVWDRAVSLDAWYLTWYPRNWPELGCATRSVTGDMTFWAICTDCSWAVCFYTADNAYEGVYLRSPHQHHATGEAWERLPNTVATSAHPPLFGIDEPGIFWAVWATDTAWEHDQRNLLVQSQPYHAYLPLVVNP